MIRIFFLFAATMLALGCEASPKATLYYTYNVDGEPVYVTSMEEIPEHLRDLAGTIDLSGLYADQTLAERVAGKVHVELGSLRRSASCAAASFEQNLDQWRVVWYRYGPWVLVGLGILGLLLLTPMMSNALPAGMWTRVLFFMIPGLLAIGMLAVTAQRASSSIAALQELNALCDTDDLPKTPQAEAQRVLKFRNLTERLYHQRTSRLDAALREAGIRFDE